MSHLWYLFIEELSLLGNTHILSFFPSLPFFYWIYPITTLELHYPIFPYKVCMGKYFLLSTDCLMFSFVFLAHQKLSWLWRKFWITETWWMSSSASLFHNYCVATKLMPSSYFLTLQNITAVKSGTSCCPKNLVLLGFAFPRPLLL